MAGEKTEKPTEQKKKQARKDGSNSPRTPDLGAWVAMLAASFMLPMGMEAALERARSLLTQVPAIIDRPDLKLATGMLSDALIGIAMAVGPLAITMMLLGLGAAGAQGGIHVATKLFIPKFSRLNPAPGLKRMFGPQSLWEGAKAAIKTGVLGVVLYITVKDLVPALMTAGQLPLGSLLSLVTDAVLALIRSAAAAGLVMAAADYAVVRRRSDKKLKMSKQDIKDEHKKSEGDPHVKGQIRSKQMAMARSRMMSDLPQADVVMVNPTHVAVALRYDPAKGAPRVVAKGAGAVAAKIREVAAEHRIPMVQDVPLARALHKSCEVGQEIPAEFYGAVAKVLAFVMSLKARGSAAGVHRPYAGSAVGG